MTTTENTTNTTNLTRKQINDILFDIDAGTYKLATFCKFEDFDDPEGCRETTKKFQRIVRSYMNYLYYHDPVFRKKLVAICQGEDEDDENEKKV